MENNEIVFFDELGFGWVVERSISKSIHTWGRDNDKDEAFIERTLADLLRRV